MGALDFNALFEASGGTPEEQAAAVATEPTIDFDALHAQSEGSSPVSSTPVTPVTPQSTVGEATKVAEQVATTAVAVSEVVAPGVSQAPISSGSEGAVLGIEGDAAAILKLFPPLAAYSGLVVPAQVVTHLVYAFVGLFKHHVATVQAQNDAGASSSSAGK